MEHAAASAFLAPVIWFATGDATGACVAAFVQLFLDMDHVIEHLFKGEHPFSLKEFTAPYNSLNWERMVFVLHSHEMVVILAVIAWYERMPILGWAALGYGIHLLLDEVGNRRGHFPVSISQAFYFLGWRTVNGFRTEYLTAFRTIKDALDPAYSDLRSRRTDVSTDFKAGSSS